MNEICARSGMAPSSISVDHIRGSQSSDISQRGLLSLDAESTKTAKKQLKSALKLGYKSVLDRFTNDVAFALRSTERGLTRSAMLVQDAIATAVLPNPGRSSEQKTMGVGAQGSMQYGAGANAAFTARLLFLRAEPADLLKASLITSMTDPTMAVSWLGAAYSLSEFANLMAVTGQVNRLITFGQSTVSWDSEAPPFEKNRQSALQYLRHIVDADTAAAERTASKQEEDARRSQQAQPKYSEPYPAKGRGKGGSSSSTTGTSPAQAEAARSSYSSYGSYGRRGSQEWRGRWYWDYTRNCWAEF